MPLYEYGCRDCGATFELRLKYDERLETHGCPSCGGSRTVLRLSAPAAVATRPASLPQAPICRGTGMTCGCGAPSRN